MYLYLALSKQQIQKRSSIDDLFYYRYLSLTMNKYQLLSISHKASAKTTLKIDGKHSFVLSINLYRSLID